MISVIIPLYNKERIIERSLHSVLSQNYDDFEVIVVNDGSTDESAEIVKSINDSRITLIEQENGGPSKARNTGVRNAKGGWILFLDADDELLSGALKQFGLLADNFSHVDIIECKSIIRSSKDIFFSNEILEGFSKNPLKDWYFRKIGPGSNHSLFKKSIVEKYPYNENLRRYEDGELLFRMLETAKVYSTNSNVAIVNTEFSSASGVRKDIKEDFIGNLSLKGTFWKKMLSYRFFIEERENYDLECRKLYTRWYWRYDLMLCHIILKYLKKYL